LKRKIIAKEVPKKIGPLDAYKFKPADKNTDKTLVGTKVIKAMAISNIDNQKKV